MTIRIHFPLPGFNECGLEANRDRIEGLLTQPVKVFVVHAGVTAEIPDQSFALVLQDIATEFGDYNFNVRHV